MSYQTQTTYSIPIVDDEGIKFTLDQPADSLIFAVLLMHRKLNCQHAVDTEMLKLTEQDKKKLSLQKEKELTEQKLQAIYKTQYAITDSPWPNHVCIQKIKPLKEQERQLKAKISELEAEIWS
ncbi:hypothetical protein MF628_004915 [Paenibacillus polymyxa]|uniref:hypothetical protein n=1 Tax=Paenibacillus polymyxa TaxID=1406 RepID=UPI0020248BE7|nr:hypothetical protein [Paenibacillus polymyxa]URJ45134.1 hypothetical protein MF628_004915 [Paenibacillus polymyxa]